MSSRAVRIRRVVVLALVFALVASVAFPAPVLGGPFDGLKRIGRGLGRIAGKILGAPGRIATWATKWMGPVLGPVAATWLAGRIVSHDKLARLFRRSGEIQQLANDIKFIDESKVALQGIYAKQALEHAEQVEAIQQQIDELKAGGYEEGVVRELMDLRLLQEAHRKLGQSLANRTVTDQDVIRMFGKRVLQRLLGGARRVVMHEIGQELMRLLDPTVINKFIDGGMDPGTVIDLIINGDIDRLLQQRGYGDSSELRERIRRALRERLREDRDFFKGNWREELVAMLEEIAREGETEEESAESTETSVPETETDTGDDGEGGYDEPGTPEFGFSGVSLTLAPARSWNTAHRNIGGAVTVKLTGEQDSSGSFRIEWEDEDAPGQKRIAEGSLEIGSVTYYDDGSARIEFYGTFTGQIQGAAESTLEVGTVGLKMSIEPGHEQAELAQSSDDYISLDPQADFSAFDATFDVSW